MSEQALFGELLRQLRVERDLTQERLAEQTDCAVQTIRMLEHGRRRPSQALAERLAQVLVLTPDEQRAFLKAARRSLSLPLNKSTHTLSIVPPPSRRHSLPSSAHFLIGRDAEQHQIISQMAEGTRLFVLVGPGGIGKTRLALHIAGDIVAQRTPLYFEEGAAFVELTPISDASKVAAAISHALGYSLPSDLSPETHLLAYLRNRSLLLVLDNLEHLLVPGQAEQLTGLISAIIREAPGVVMLVTSRERLRLRGERVVELAGLTLPNGNLATAADSEAVRLFVERAQQSDSDFELTPENTETVMRICHLLAGAPLALELAAGWVRALSCKEIEAELARGLDFLEASDRDVDPRHRSIRTVLDQSWVLLSDDERRVLMRLSVFRGGCLREAAQAVAGATPALLLALIDQSLLQFSEMGRYSMHELLRQYAETHLNADPELAAETYRQHCLYFARVMHESDHQLKGPQQRQTVARLLDDIDNIRAARIYAIQHRLFDALWQMEHNSALGWFYELRSWYREGMQLAQELTEMLRSLPPRTPQEWSLLGNAFGLQGWFQFRCGKPEQGLKLLEESLAIVREQDHLTFRFFTLEQLSYLLFFTGEFERSVAFQDEALAVAQQINDPWITSHAYFLRAAIFEHHDPELAYTRFHEGIAHIREVGDRMHLILALFSLGNVALERGEPDEAAQLYEELQGYSIEIGNSIGLVLAQAGLAMVDCTRGEWDAAITRCRAALEHSNEIGDQWSHSKVLKALGMALIGKGKLEEARVQLANTIRQGLAAFLHPDVIDAWLTMAKLDIKRASLPSQLPTVLQAIRHYPGTGKAAKQRAERLWQQLPPHLRPTETPTPAPSNDALGQAMLSYINSFEVQQPTTNGASPQDWQGKLLTQRELEVLRLLMQGHTNQQIAQELIMALGTVKRHVNSILAKLQVSNRLAAVARARELRIQ